MDEQRPADIRETPPRRWAKPLIASALFAATFLTTLAAGAMQQGVNPLESPQELWQGLPFAATLLLILGCHEFGHFIVSRRHRVEVTYPYFIPAPSFIGTFGAFIKMKSPIPDRRTLLDIGVAGPLAGVAVALPVLVVGLALSEQVQGTPSGAGSLGVSLLFYGINHLVNGPTPDGIDLVLHPAAFSGWIGLLVTSLNLLPVGQLDGGHVAYALFGKRHKIVALTVVAALFVLGVFAWIGWLVWGVILMIMGIHHPPVVYDGIPLDRKRLALGWITILLFVLTFTPVPFSGTDLS